MVSKLKIFSYLVEKSNHKVYDYLPILKIIFRGLKGKFFDSLKNLQKAAYNPKNAFRKDALLYFFLASSERRQYTVLNSEKL
jgi:hypothetical protein